MITKRLERRIFKICQELFEVPNGNKHFSFICDRNRIVCLGWNNTRKTHPLANKFQCRFNAIHSELDAILNFPYRVSDISSFSLVNVRLMMNRSVGLSKPCKPCQNLLNFFGVNDVTYSTAAGWKIL